MFQSALEIPKKRKKEFHSSLCIVCQTAVEQAKRGPKRTVSEDQFKVFIDVCKDLKKSDDGSYLDLQQEILNKTAKQLQDEKYCFHTQCRSKFQKIFSNQKQKRLSSESGEKLEGSSKVSRQETVSFDKNRCLFCQTDISGYALFSVRQTSRDQELKNAFLECPTSLALYNIRSSHAHDAMAGDIKYHNSCWLQKIVKRTPEIKVQKTSSSISLNTKLINEISVETDDNISLLEISDTDLSNFSHDKSIELRNGRSITLNEDTGSDDVPDSSLKQVVITEIIEGLKIELSSGKAITLNNLVTLYKARMAENGLIDPKSDKALRMELQRIVSKRVVGKMKGVILEKAYRKNESQRIMTNDIKAFALQYAEENILSPDEEIALLKQASMILRKRTLNFIQNNPSHFKDFKAPSQENEQFPPELLLFVDGLIFGQRKLSSVETNERKVLSNTIASSVMHNIKTDRQVNYASKRKTNSRRKYLPKQTVALALSIRHCERNNAILRLLSAPNFGLTIPPRTTLLFETMIANAMIKIKEKEGVYIPPNMERGVRVSFHIDNFDEQVQTFDGKNTVHYLLIVCFQRRIQEFKPIELELEASTSLTLQDNSFGDIIPCDEPSNRQFKRTEGCINVTCASGFIKCRSSTIPVWKYLRSFEQLLVRDESATFVSGNITVKIAPRSSQDQIQHWNLNSLKLPSLSATNSLVVTMDQTLTNVFPLPFVAGPASSTSAVYTALDIAHKTSIATRSNSINEAVNSSQFNSNVNTDETLFLTRPLDPPPGWKTIIVLDLDLYSKAYKLVQSRSDLRKRYVLCLGELHIVFAGIRAIGSFIDSSGIDDAWMGAKWFDSESLLRQVKDCSNMKRALATHEATFIAMQTLVLKETLQWYDRGDLDLSEIFHIVKSARDAINGNQTESEKFKEAWLNMKSSLEVLDLESKIEEFILFHQENYILQFFVKYCDMVTRLFTFIEATRSRDWQLHLDSLEDMIPDFASMDRINYRRLSAVYIADMKHLQISDPETWNYFAEGNFCCQKNDITYTAIGRDHCGEQENKVLKGRGGVSGQSSNSNSTIRHFMTAPILSQMYSEMMSAGGHSDQGSKYHHQLTNAYTSKQNRWVISLLRLFEKLKVSLSTNEKEESFYNIVTGQIFPKAIYLDLVGAYDKGLKMVEVFTEERLKPESKLSIFAPLKRSKVKTCKSANKGAEIKYKDQVAILKEENVFISRIAMIRGSREVDMKSLIGNHELTPIVHSLMRRDGILLDGWEGKSELTSRVLQESNVCVVPELFFRSECIAIDAMYVMNQISTKPLWVKTGNDLAAEFCKRIDQQSDGAEIIIIGFEWYLENSLKASAWESRKIKGKGSKTKVNRVDYNIEADTDLSKRCMKDILGTIATKRSLTKLLMTATLSHLRSRGVEFFIAGNGITYSSWSGEGVTNHKEGETAIVLGLSCMQLHQKRVTVYGNDVDLFVLLLAHYTNIDCLEIHMKSLHGYTSITAVYNFLGNDVAMALLPFHALTGCDVTGKFYGKGKEFLTGKFLADRTNSRFIQSLLRLHSCEIDDVLHEITGFICRSYCPKKTPNTITSSLVETRYFLYRKFSAETSKLPPSPGAFYEHVKRACCPLVVWHSANLPMTVTIDHLLHGWEIKEKLLMPVCSLDNIAPEGLLELASCNCKGDCSKGWCTCKKSNVACTDFCGCGEECENTDAPPPEGALNTNEQDEEQYEECSEEDLKELETFLQEIENDPEQLT